MLLGILFAFPAICAAAIGMGCGAFQSLAWLWVLPVSYIGAFLVTLLLIGALILIASTLVDTGKPQKKNNPFYRWLTHQVIDLALALLPVTVHTQGLEQDPEEERIFLVCNHLHEIDPAVLLKFFQRHKLAFIAKQEVLKMPVIGPFMHKLMCQTLNRENDRQALRTILTCVELIKKDEVSIGVFPEGYIRPDRKLRHFRSGVFKVAKKTGVPIVVCTMRNTHRVLPNALKLKRTDVHMHLVGVVRPEEYASLSTVELGNLVYDMMAKDLGPENVSQEG